MRLHFLLALMIFAGLALSFVEAARLHLPTGESSLNAGAWLPGAPGNDAPDLAPNEATPEAGPLAQRDLALVQ